MDNLLFPVSRALFTKKKDESSLKLGGLDSNYSNTNIRGC